MTGQPYLVLLHGALGDREQLAPLANALHSSFRVHRLDFEGHGNAAPPARPFRIRHFAENVLDLLDEQGIGAARFFGYSMGGYVATYLAGATPERVERVLTLGTKFRWDPSTAEREAARLDPAKIRTKVPQFAESLAKRHAAAGGWEGVLAATAEFLRDLGAHPVLDNATLARVRQPVRVMIAEHDNTVMVDEGQEIARALGDGSFAVLPNGAHPIEQVDVEALAAAIRAFFA